MAVHEENHMARGISPPKFPYPDATESQLADWREEERKWRRLYNTCATCGSHNVHVENYSMMWHDGDVFCENGHYVRMWDAG